MGVCWRFPVNAFLICSLFFIIQVNAQHHTNEKKHSFDYKSNSTGPEEWGNLKPEWETCLTGKLQSPIDLLHERIQILSTLGNLKRRYKCAAAHIKKRGHDVMVEWIGDAGGLIINGTMFKLIQCHWHTPSEHTIQGKKFRMELHMVHTNSEGEIAVVGILYKLGHPDPFLEKILGHVASINHEHDEDVIDGGYINPWNIKFGSRKYYRYLGSLTVPPCTEGVIWSLLVKVRTVSIEQLRALRKAVDKGFEENARPLQPLDERTIYMYRPHP